MNKQITFEPKIFKFTCFLRVGEISDIVGKKPLKSTRPTCNYMNAVRDLSCAIQFLMCIFLSVISCQMTMEPYMY